MIDVFVYLQVYILAYENCAIEWANRQKLKLLEHTIHFIDKMQPVETYGASSFVKRCSEAQNTPWTETYR